MKQNNYAVVTSYSFDTTTTIRVFDTAEDAVEFMKSVFEEERNLDIESGKNPRAEINPEETEAFIENVSFDRTSGKDVVDRTEWRFSDDIIDMRKKPADAPLFETVLEPKEQGKPAPLRIVCEAGTFEARPKGGKPEDPLSGIEVWFQPNGKEPEPLTCAEYSREDKGIACVQYAGDPCNPAFSAMSDPAAIGDPPKPVQTDDDPEKVCYNLCAVRKVKLTGQDIDYIMASAIEGGVCYWCRQAELINPEKLLGEFDCEQISRGGTIRFYDVETGEFWDLTLQKFLTGFRRWVEKGYDRYGALQEDGTVDCGQIDGPAADAIVQLALFGELVYG